MAKPFHPVPSQHAQESCVHPELGNPWICADNLRKGWIFQDAISSSQGQLSGARAAEMLPAGDWSDHVMLVLFGAGILNIPQKTEEQGYFWLRAVSFLGLAIR